MALWGCLDCTALYAVGLPRCPHCGGTRYEENGMPKLTVHGGGTAEVVEAAPVAEPESGPSGFEEWTRAELVDEAKRRGVPHGGSKAALLERLNAPESAGEE